MFYWWTYHSFESYIYNESVDPFELLIHKSHWSDLIDQVQFALFLTLSYFLTSEDLGYSCMDNVYGGLAFILKLEGFSTCKPM